MPATMAGSERRFSEAGPTWPKEAWTQLVESSIDTIWGPLACTSFSMRPMQGSR